MQTWKCEGNSRRGNLAAHGHNWWEGKYPYSNTEASCVRPTSILSQQDGFDTLLHDGHLQLNKSGN